MSVLISSMYFLVLVFLVIMLVKITMKGSEKDKPLASVYLKIFLNHF